MPFYDYICSCGNEFEKRLQIAEVKKPTTEPCPSCGESNVTNKMGAPIIADIMRVGTPKATGAFADRIKQISRQHKGTKMLDGKFKF